MLDQNTDRMWYVIGAVIVGAAIIFLVNSSFPQLFASVGDTFKNQVDSTSAVIAGIDSNNQGTDASVLKLRVISVGNESTNPVSGAARDSQIYMPDGKLINERVGYRGLLMYVFNDKNELEFQAGYDTHGYDNETSNIASKAMTSKIKSITDSSKLIIVVAMDSINGGSVRHLLNGLDEAMYSIGASSEVYENVTYREPYILVGKPGLKKGNGYDVKALRGETLDINVSIKNGTSSLIR